MLVYLGCILLFGLPLMLCEIAIGRKTGRNPYGAFKALQVKRSRMADAIAVLLLLGALSLAGAGHYGFAAVLFGAALLFLIGALSLPNMTFSPLRFDCTLQPVKVAARLLDGSMSRYSQAYDALVAEIKAHPGEEIHSASQPQDDILNANWLYTGDPQDWRNQGLCLYYGDGCTLVYDP